VSENKLKREIECIQIDIDPSHSINTWIKIKQEMRLILVAMLVVRWNGLSPS
jgi:hypothetical protein